MSMTVSSHPAPRRRLVFIAVVLVLFSSVCMYLYLVGLLSQLSSSVAPVSASGQSQRASPPSQLLARQWYAPASTWINNLTSVLHDSGVHGFIFNASAPPPSAEPSQYNWCNMPHVNPQTYSTPPRQFELVYVEVIHRHHKRTPYQDNSFPVESYPWDCSDQSLFFYGQPLGPDADVNSSAQVYWQIQTNPINPFRANGFAGSCQFPQITRHGLEDSWRHGKDLRDVYGGKVNFLPPTPDATVVYRVTSNTITSQVAGMLIRGMFSSSQLNNFPLSIQPPQIDSLHPGYDCPRASSLYSSYAVGSSDQKWRLHLDRAQAIFQALDAVSGIPPGDDGFHRSFDHYYDNLSARQCHQKALPCSASNPQHCITQDQADTVYRIGQYEYSYIYRDSHESLEAAIGSYGVWVAELISNIREALSGRSLVRYRHNIAHDGSLARLLSILQVKVMVWPGMGAEIVFEIYKHKHTSGHFVRILWGGKPLESSHPGLGKVDMIDLEVLVGYLEGLVGREAQKVVEMCNCALEDVC
ncbi:hypothetical protein TWF696_007103 [Orbilia brochopaga]|uniref:Phosphoglycerate mutase-like protein n=1 Tax=Orbilia brochopaga TaxID=3140254 RepID=A0AAV9UV46_9PEZI